MAQRLGKYEIIEEIGRGGFATVYRARDPDLDREVALKVLDPALMRDPSLVERFRREARAAARLRHPGIVTIHEIGQAEGMLFIAMELLPGPSLKAIVESEAPLPVERAAELLRPLAEALDYAHAQGLVHRDVKPANVLLDERETPKLMDLGLVRAAEESGSSAVSLTLSQTGMTLGTPAYMAPEQADPEAQSPADRRADLYSLGVIAYEMLTGRVPFEGTTPLAVAMAHLIKAPPTPRELNPALPEGVEAALLKMLTKKPEERFESAGAFAEALAAVMVRPEMVVPKPEDTVTPLRVSTAPLPRQPSRADQAQSDDSKAKVSAAELNTLFDAGLDAFHSGDWPRAKERLSQVVQQSPLSYRRAGYSANELLAEIEQCSAPPQRRVHGWVRVLMVLVALGAFALFVIFLYYWIT